MTGEFAELARWLRDEGLALLPTTDALLLVDDGESRFRIDRTSGGWVVKKSLRGAPLVAQMSSTHWEDVDRYVVMLYLGTARESRGLSRLRRLVKLDAEGNAVPADDWGLHSADGGGFVLTGPEGHRVWFDGDIPAAEFSRYAVYTADELRAQTALADAPLAESRPAGAPTGIDPPGDMITPDDAVRAAEHLLREQSGETGADLVVVGAPSEISGHWVVGYNSRAYVEEGDVASALAGNGPIAVPQSGAPPFFLSPVRTAIDQLGDEAPEIDP